MKSQTNEWIEQGDYDIGSAGTMYRSGRYLYTLYMCQQAVEKYLKAFIIEKHSNYPPPIHNLRRLAEISKLDSSMNEKKLSFFDKLTPFCIAARYPDYRKKLDIGLNKEITQKYLHETRRIIKWLGQKIK